MMLEIVTAALAFPEISPAAFSIPNPFGEGSFPIRWYALGYIAGILLAWWYVLKLIARPALFGGEAPATREDVDDLIFWIMLGIILGGRLGYILFYQIPFQGLSDPASILRVWEGGMSFHGGMIGVSLAVYFISKRRGIKLSSISDMAAIVAPIGIFLVRCANFINAELYGRHTTSSIGVTFPEGNAGGTPPAYDWANKAWVYTETEMPRHASQLYEAVLEGLLPLIVLSILAWGFGLLKRPWLATGLFLLMYGVGRSVAENFRMPDAHISFIAGDFLTMGMLLSAPMYIAGAYLVWRGLSKPAVGSAKA